MRAQHEDVGLGSEERGQFTHVARHAAAAGMRHEQQQGLAGLRQAAEGGNGTATGLAVVVIGWNNGVARWGHGSRGRTARILPEPPRPVSSPAFPGHSP